MKSHVSLATGSLVGMAAIVGFLPSTQILPSLLLVAVACIILSLCVALLHMSDIVSSTAAQRYVAAGQRPLASWGSLMIGLTSFGLYVLYNVPQMEKGQPKTAAKSIDMFSSSFVQLWSLLATAVPLMLVISLVVWSFVARAFSRVFVPRTRQRSARDDGRES
jgi:hypothetical protein